MARVCCDDWRATASLIVNFDLDFSICFTFHKSRLSFHLQMEIWKYPTGFCQLSFAWLRFVFTLRITHFSSGALDRVSGVKPRHVKARICWRKMHMWFENNCLTFFLLQNYIFLPLCPSSARQFLIRVCCMNISGYSLCSNFPMEILLFTWFYFECDESMPNSTLQIYC